MYHYLIKYILLLCFFLSSFFIKAQDSLSNSSADLGVDLVSRYLWRGMMLGSNAPNIQPYFSYSYKNFTIGNWDSYSTNGGYSEIDLYLAYTLGRFTITATDYYCPNESVSSHKFFHFEESTTLHSVEGTIKYEGGDKFPLSLTAASFAWGLDKDSTGENYYSTYFEAGYPFSIKDYTFDIFVGMTPSEGMYGNDIGVINAGINVSKDIKITNDFSLPIKATLMYNPQKENIFGCIWITLK